MSSINPSNKQLLLIKKIIKEVLLKSWKNSKYIFIKRNVEKIIIPPSKGTVFEWSFLILSGWSISLVISDILCLNLLIMKIEKKDKINKIILSAWILPIKC